tara:strand:- start:321 stop:863 length:543 start_codon:yes stop_codon:yes gene_type:complete
MKYPKIITVFISGILGIPTYLPTFDPQMSSIENFIVGFFAGVILYSIPVGIVIYVLNRRSLKKATELKLSKTAKDKELADAKAKKLADEKRKKAEKEIIALKEDVEKDVQKYSSELKTKVESLEKEALSLIEVVESEVQTLDDLESRHKQIGKIVKSRKKDDGNSEDIKEIKNLLKKINK